MSNFRVVQPGGLDRGRQATLISEHESITAAFEHIDRLVAQMKRTGARTDAIELIVTDGEGSNRPPTAGH